MANLTVTGPTVTSASIADNSIVNADVNTAAAIAASKLALSIRAAAGVPTGAPTGNEIPVAIDTTAVSGGLYVWTGAAWVQGSVIP